VAADVGQEVQQHLVEPTVDGGTTFASGLWTVTEVINYFNQRQYRFLRDTQLLLTRTSLVTTPNVNRQPLPTDWIVTSRATWQDIANMFTEIPRGDTWEADHAILDWPYNGSQRPQLWTDGGVSDPLPITFARQPPLGATHIIVSDCRWIGTAPVTDDRTVWIRPRMAATGTLWTPRGLAAAVRQGELGVTPEIVARIRRWTG